MNKLLFEIIKAVLLLLVSQSWYNLLRTDQGNARFATPETNPPSSNFWEPWNCQLAPCYIWQSMCVCAHVWEQRERERQRDRERERQRERERERDRECLCGNCVTGFIYFGFLCPDTVRFSSLSRCPLESGQCCGLDRYQRNIHTDEEVGRNMHTRTLVLLPSSCSSFARCSIVLSEHASMK